MILMKVNWIKGQGHDSNIFLIQDKSILMIDAGTGQNFEWARKKVEDFGIKVKDLDILINTHCHFDHAGGNSNFLEESSCKLMASKPAAEALRNGDKKVTLAEKFGEDLKPLEFSQTLEENDKIELGETTLEVLSTPGHSRGSISLYEPEAKALFSGDVVFRGGIGRTDLPTSDSKVMKESLQKLAKLDVKTLYPGHGAIAEENAKRYIKLGLDLLP